MAKTRARTGDRRQRQQPLKIDKLPLSVRDAIQSLKNGRGKTWQEIEEISALPFDERWADEVKRYKATGGFVNWDAIDAATRRLFPGRRLPHSNLHRWYDIRVAQVTEETLARSEQARTIAEAFAKSVVDKDDLAVLNAARDQIMSVLAEDASPKGRMAAAGALIALAEMMQEARANTIKERKVAIDERKIKAVEAREALLRGKLEAEAEKLKKKAVKGQVTAEDLARLTERTFGFRAKPAEGAAHG
jgi:hypothetical protein